MKAISLLNYHSYHTSRFFNSIKPNLYNDCSESRLKIILGGKTQRGEIMYSKGIRSTNKLLQEVRHLSRMIRLTHYTNESMLFREGDEGDGLYIIDDGAVQGWVRDKKLRY